jgi:hypothetical protein
VEERYLVATGASDTSCVCSYRNEVSGIEHIEKGDELETTKKWPPFPFWGDNRNISILATPGVTVHTANGDDALTKIYFDEGFITAQLDDMPPINVQSLSMPGHLHKYITSRFLQGDGNLLNPPASTQTSLLGRDILFKHFTLLFSKPVSQDVEMTLTARERKTPTASTGKARAFIAKGIGALASLFTGNETSESENT